MNPLRILHVHTSYGWRGGENQVYLLLKGLKERGVESFLVTSPGSALSEKAKEIEIPVKEINFKSELDLVAINIIVKILREKKIDILHAHTSHAHSLAGISGRIAGKRVVVTRRVDFPPRGILSRWKYHRLVDIIIAISHAIERILRDIGIPQERIRYVPSAFDPRKLERIMDTSYLFKEFSIESPVVGTIAHLTDHKGHVYLLRAIPWILKRFPRATFLIVGKGELGNYLEREARKLGITERVIFTGFREDIPEILSILDLFVLPSHMEGLGSILLEAQYMGIPVVSTLAGGIPEVVRNGETGILVPPRDPDSLSKAVIDLLENKEKRESFSLQGKKWAKNFFPERMVEGTLAVYSELVNI